ncbi:Coiled-coil domain-containing protein 103 [Tetrabaena socialis]|uniref:Coiled-coil domain-containing protein 103 n=1 Tax=Tetrabaena socialis TaxID=47790 RepID=A0A2J8AGI2_9CHLO|nr:Coiled-coil domain-containing protein 103 [Tetrabaena socialis]|eukprot:PNH11606.1 Coiled-coil domain-containing protein 103 [Tetrabaena socialis]
MQLTMTSSAIDEAKKRAVSQRVDYDSFKNMVLTAHLKPLGAPSKGTDRPLPCWNFGIDGKVAKEQPGTAQLAAAPSQAPSSSGDFYRDWRRNCPGADDKYRYLKMCGPDVLRAVFRVEVSGEVLRDMLSVLDECWLGHAGAAAEEAEQQAGEAGERPAAAGAAAGAEQQAGEAGEEPAAVGATASAGQPAGEAGEQSAGVAAEGCGAGSGGDAALREAALVVRMLEALSGAGRFSLTVKLLGTAGRAVLQRLFAGLAAAAEAAGAGADADAAGAAAAEAGGAGADASADAAGAAAGGTPAQGAAPGAGGMCSPAQLAALRSAYGLPAAS